MRLYASLSVSGSPAVNGFDDVIRQIWQRSARASH
jgi:hypothetical protein